MKLLLTSAGITNKTLARVVAEQISLPKEKTRVAFVPTAANVEDGDKRWLMEEINGIER